MFLIRGQLKNMKYKEIYNKEILEKSKGIIFSYTPITDEFKYCAYSHNIGSDNVESLAELMRHNLLFYSYGEEEVEKYYNYNQFKALEDAAKYAYQQRVPQRDSKKDGLLSETLLDLLVQIYSPSAQKLAVRTIFRQDDKNEIKGYDLTYFSKENSEVSLWLGQAKLGDVNYCKSGLNQDLLDKFTELYLSKQMFFICDKPMAITPEAKEILSIIEKINIINMNNDKETRSKELLKCFKKNNISIKIPCLLAYERMSVYYDFNKINVSINKEIDSVKNYFQSKNYSFSGFNPEIVFYIFPIESLKRIRDKETGFYAGLC